MFDYRPKINVIESQYYLGFQVSKKQMLDLYHPAQLQFCASPLPFCSFH